MALPGWLRDALVLVAVFGVLLGGLYAYTGSWPPAVIVESGSMMHKECAEGQTAPACDPGVKYGRIGTIDPGDLVLVKAVDDPDDVQTLVEGGKERYGKSGDVIVYYRANDRGQTPIIHRAVAYVVVEGAAGSATYFVRWGSADCEGGATKVEREGKTWCQYDSEGIYIPSVPVQAPGSTPASPNPYRPVRSGFITKGDNPSTNPTIDQHLGGLSTDERGVSVPVQMEWIGGKGRAELPWLGLIKLALAKGPNQDNPPAAWARVGNAYAPKDLWVMLGVTLFLLVGVPLIYDGYKAYQARQASKLMPGAPSAVNAQLTDHGSVTLSWPHVEGVHSYRVYRGDERIGSTAETSYEDLRAASGNTYTYSVSAVSDAGNEGPRSPAATVHLP